MALELTIKDASGRTANNCYWVPVQINVGGLDMTGKITFYGFASREAFAAKLPSVQGAVKDYSFSKEEFESAQMIPLGDLFPEGVKDTDIMYSVLARFAYGVARSRKDVAVLDVDGKPLLDTEGKPVMKSFFEEAENV